MQNKQQLKSEIELVGTLKMVVQSLQEISVMKMQRIRNSVVSTRDFLDRLSEIFADVKESYRHEIMKIMQKKKKGAKISFSTGLKNKKSVTVLLSANSKLHGDIINKVCRAFMDSVKEGSDDIIIVGKLGRELYDTLGSGKKYEYFEIPDEDVKMDHLKSLITSLVQYEKINVYYGKFSSIMSQEAATTNVTGDRDGSEALISEVKPGEKGIPQRYFLFEPSLEEILRFFETQVFSSLFKQTVDEATLARYASRIRAMEDALSNIDDREKSLSYDERKMRHHLENKKQQELVSGMRLWVN